MSNEYDFDRVPDAAVAKRRAPVLVRVLGSLIGWSMFTVLAVGGLIGWMYSVYTSDGPLKEAKVITIAEGQGRAEIGQLLKDQGIINDARVMNAASLLNNLRGGTLKPGEYQFQPGNSMATVLNILSSGKVLTYKLTIPEGWTSQLALARINNNEFLIGDPVVSVPEGALIADTQVFRRGMTRAKLVEDMVAAQTKIVDELWARRAPDTVLKSKEELVTLASIVEKETAKADERPRVAAVFLNRLKQKMRLQSDPTIIYGLVGGQGKLDRPLTRADIDGATPYNTYQIDGLPPGPIAVPGRAALEAVIAPAQTADIFFVADGSGGHAFAATLDAHNANVKKWREIQKSGIVLPGQPEAEPEPDQAVQQVEQAPLPAVENKPETDAAPVADDQQIDAAAKNAEIVQGVPQPAEGDAGQQPAVAAPKPAEPPKVVEDKKPKAEEKPVKEADKVAEPAKTETAEKPVAEAVAKPPKPPKPGSVVKVKGKLVPIPKLKVAKP